MNLTTAICALRVGVMDIPATGARDHCARALAIIEAEVPAMLAALRRIIAWDDAGCDPSTKSLDAARAILTRIDGTPTGEAGTPSGGIEARDHGASAAASLSRAALIEAAGEAEAMGGEG